MESSWLATVTCVCVYKHTDSESIGRRTRRAQSALLLVDPNRNILQEQRRRHGQTLSAAPRTCCLYALQIQFGLKLVSRYVWLHYQHHLHI